MKNVLFIVIAVIIQVHAGDYSVPITFELKASGINRSLQEQYNSSGFLFQRSGTVDGIDYTINLAIPTIIFKGGQIKLKMIISCSTLNHGNYGPYTIKPSIAIAQNSITSDRLVGYMIDFPNIVDECNEIPLWLKRIIMTTYSQFSPWLFPSKLIEEAENSSEWLKQRNVDLNNPNWFTLGWQVTDNLLKIIVNLNVNASKPVLKCAFANIPDGPCLFLVSTNIKVQVYHIKIYNLGGGPLIWEGYPENVFCYKDDAISIYMRDEHLSSSKIAIVLWKTDDTFYYTYHKGITNYVSNGIYYLPYYGVNY